MFFMYFADFWANFCDFLTFVLFYCLKWVLKRPLLLEKFSLTNSCTFVDMKQFFVEKYDQKKRKLEQFLNFCNFFFIGSLDTFLSLL